MVKIFIWENTKRGSRQKMIGDLQDGVFTKRVSKAKHLFKKSDSWGVDAEYFTRVLLPNDFTIKVYDKDEKKTYTVSAEKFRELGAFYHFPPHRSQIFLSRVHFEVT